MKPGHNCQGRYLKHVHLKKNTLYTFSLLEKDFVGYSISTFIHLNNGCRSLTDLLADSWLGLFLKQGRYCCSYLLHGVGFDLVIDICSWYHHCNTLQMYHDQGSRINRATVSIELELHPVSSLKRRLLSYNCCILLL